MQSEDNAALWEKVHAARQWGRYPSEELIRFIVRNFSQVPRRSDIRIFEMGCGQGANVWYLLREGFSVSGIDCAPSAISKTIERLKAEGFPVDPAHTDLRVGDFSKLPWDDDSFDAVLDIEAIYANRTDVIERCVAECLRILRPDGRFFGKMFGVKTTGYGTGTTAEAGTSADPRTGACAGLGLSHFFDEDEIRRLFTGFRDLQLDWVHRSDRNGAVEVFEWIVQAKK